MYIDDVARMLREFEGDIPWFYLDGPGNVTVGVGCLIRTLAEALTLPLMLDGAAASPAEIATDFARVAAMKPNCGPVYYKAMTSVSLADADRLALVQARLAAFVAQLRAFFAGFDGFPDAAQCALLDMAYNLGAKKLETGYPLFCAAVRRGDWPAAAAQCHRNGPNLDRNQWTRLQFLDAGETAATSSY